VFDARQILTLVDEARFDTGTLQRLHVTESNLGLANDLVQRIAEQAKLDGVYEDWGPPTRAGALAEMVSLLATRPEGMDTLKLAEKLEALADELEAWNELPADQVDNAVLQTKLTEAKAHLDSLEAFMNNAISLSLDIYGEIG
jgi:hypothetical protein